MNQTASSPGWANRWIGGFCAPGIFGGPIRDAAYASPATLDESLLLPAHLAQGKRDGHPAGAQRSADLAALWAALAGNAAVVLVRNVRQARTLLLQALAPAPGAVITLPANASHALVETVKRQMGVLRVSLAFAELDASLQLILTAASGITWLEPVAGQPVGGDYTGYVVDYAASVPTGTAPPVGAAAVLYGLHLHPAADRAGALLVFGDRALAGRVRAAMVESDHLSADQERRAFVQQQRLATVIDQQKAAVRRLWQGIDEAAGVVLQPYERLTALPHGVLVEIPAETEPAMFYWFARGENTPVRWLPELRPLHYAAAPTCPATAARLARWLLIPCGPVESEESIRHAVLGVVKTAEYLGVRWRTDPDRAAAYARVLDEIYGASHDAYRPVFDTAAAQPERVEQLLAHFQITSCRVPVAQKEQAQ